MTTFHCTKLCPCDACAPIRWALSYVEGLGKPLGSYAAVCHREGTTYLAAWWASHDPAKLAELIASALRARGIDVACDWSDRHDFYVAWWPNDPTYVDGTQWIHVRAGRYGRFNGLPTDEWTMVQARAKLLAIMQTSPNKLSREACERILKGEP